MSQRKLLSESLGPRKAEDSLPLTHKAHAGLVQVNGFPEDLSSCPDLCQLTRQVLHQGHQLSPDIVALHRIQEMASDQGGEGPGVGYGMQQIKRNHQKMGNG